jgi:hypothetical protein
MGIVALSECASYHDHRVNTTFRFALKVFFAHIIAWLYDQPYGKIDISSAEADEIVGCDVVYFCFYEHREHVAE